jgi:beta-galactosidase
MAVIMVMARHDGNFCMNGLVFPDREVPPKLLEVKKVHQYIAVEHDNLAAYRTIEPPEFTPGDVSIKNKYFFTNLNEFDIAWSLAEDGQVIQQGRLDPIDVAPRDSWTLQIPYTQPEIKAGAEYWIRITFLLREDKLWAAKGHEVAYQQLRAPFEVPAKPVMDLKAMPALIIDDTDQRIAISGDDFAVMFSRETGTLASLQYGGKAVIREDAKSINGPIFNAFRAPTDNDKFLKNEWYDAGLNRLQREVENVTVERLDAAAVQVSLSTLSRGTGDGGFRLHSIYTVLGNGAIDVDNRITPPFTLLTAGGLGNTIYLPSRSENERQWLRSA